MNIKRSLTWAFDKTSVTWHRLTDELPTTQDFVDDMDAVARGAAGRLRNRKRAVSAPDTANSRRPDAKSREQN